ncbi:hypothetical protein [Planktothricoides sp. SR001]|uniref:hypothetical protein n=1 Tax=Planktothricoides sp. SR001 TaxID=1705388 RepID=UPI0012E25498|nr:hypothetical protein [Planktothricoides sp. SR001]
MAPTRNPVSLLGCLGATEKPGFFRPSLSPHQNAHRNPVSLLGCLSTFLAIGALRRE